MDDNKDTPQINSKFAETLKQNICEALNKKAQLQVNNSKSAARAMHQQARIARLDHAQAWITSTWPKLEAYFADGDQIIPSAVSPTLIPVETQEHKDLFRMARYTWSLPYSKGYGRRMRFLVIDNSNNCLIGILGLQSAPIDFRLRDQDIQYPEGQKVSMVNQTMDIFTLGAIPPYNQLLGGKLMVYTAASQEIRMAYQAKYADATTEITKQVIPPHLVLLTTTSAFGRSSIYNRVAFLGPQDPAFRRIAEPLGMTKGYGTFFLETLYPDIKEFLTQAGYKPNKGFGEGPKPVWQNISKAMTLLKISGGLNHGVKREVWSIPLAKDAWEYLSGTVPNPTYYPETFPQLANWWQERWLLPRAERVSSWAEHRKTAVTESIIAPS